MKKILTIIILFLCQYLSAQTPFLRRYTVDDGLPSSHVYRVFQDSNGFLWICTDKGLARFDGYNFEKFSTNNGLPYNDVWDIAEDKYKRLWLSSYAYAITYYDLKKGRFEVIPTDTIQVLNNQKTVAFIPSKDSVTYIANYNQFLKFNINKKTFIKLDKQVDTHFDFLQAKNINFKRSVLFVSSLLPHNYSFYINNNKEYFPPDLIHCKNLLQNAIFINNKESFYSCNKEIHLINNGNYSSKYITQLSKFVDNEIIRIDRFGDENLLIFTNKEIFVIDKTLNRLPKFDFINQYKVNSVYLDKEQNLWICTKDKGLLLLTNEALNSSVLNSLDNYAIKDIKKDKFNHIWIGTNTGELFVSDNNGFRKLNLPKANAFPIRTINLNPSSEEAVVVWENARVGIFKISERISDYEKKWNEIEVFTYLKESGNTLAEIPLINKGNLLLENFGGKSSVSLDDELLFGTASSLYKIKFKSKSISIKTICSQVRGISLAIDSKKNIWIGSSNGLALKENPEIDTTKNFKKIKGIAHTINALQLDQNDNLWIGTDGLGVIRLRDNKTLIINDLSDKIVNSLYYDKATKRLWVATNEGVFAITETEKDKYEVNKITLTQGLPTLEVHSVYADSDKLYAGTNNSLAVIDLKNYFDNNAKPKYQAPLIIKNIKINGRDTTRLSNYELEYKQNSIDIDFVALSYKSDKNIRYEYKLASAGSNGVWQEINGTKQSFAFLSPDRYQFYLRAFDIEGNETVLSKPIVFNIAPPFWQSWWFRILLVILGLGSFAMGVDIYRIRTKSELEISKKFAELELQALQSQMNPHFVFNALSSIQNYVLNKDTHTANEYLTNFSKLIRLFLESSRNRYIAISDEKVLLEKYIQLEQIRFNAKFSYEIKELNFIEPTFEIPSMLIQPFVENAINHGLVYKEEQGHLLVTLQQEEDYLTCVVEDDGIGRAKAKEIRTKTLKAYKSRATEIIEERLRTLKIVDGTEVTVDIIDKNDPQTGTRVEIKIENSK
jgi:ligand-binding sensor domain-containing protein